MLMFLDSDEISKQYKEGKSLWGSEPTETVKKVPSILKSGSILDIGSGEGRNAFFLAKNGFNVTGIDISSDAIERCIDSAKSQGLNITFKAISALDYKFDKKFDGIICIATLHLFKPSEALGLIKRIKENTNKAGINIISVFTVNDPGIKDHPELFFVKENELKELYSDWELIESRTYTKEQTHGKPHTHQVSIIIARK